MTWNLGGMQRSRLPEILEAMPALGLAHVELVAFQEVNMEAGIHYGKAGSKGREWLIVAGKSEWRGRATAVRRTLGIVKHRQLGSNGLGLSVATSKQHLGVFNVRLPCLQ